MVAPRVKIPDFELANPIYVGATVTFYEANSNGEATATLASLYSTQTGTAQLSNPQKLGSNGKFSQPVYIDTAVIGQVENANGVADHSTGVIGRAQELSGSVAYDPPSISAGASEQTTVTVTGAVVSDFALGSFSAANVDIDVRANVTAADTVTLTFFNRGSGAVNLAAGTAYARVLKR